MVFINPKFRSSTKICSLERRFLSEPSSFSLRLEQGQNVSIANGSLHVADDLARLLAQELDLDLGALTLRASATQNLDHASQRHLLVHVGFSDAEQQKSAKANG